VIAEPSRSFAADCLSYVRQRLLRPKIVALAAAVAACAMFVSGTPRLGFAVPAALALVWQFRLWDDLEDLPFDRIHHPERVLVASRTRGGFVAVVVATLVLVGTSLAVITGTAQTLAYAALVAASAAGYRILRTTPDRRLVRAHWVLTKYPMFVFVAATEPMLEHAVPVAVVLYLALCLLEVFDDPALRGMRAARTLAVAEAIAIAGILVYGAIR
jgi:4-hydroxybenzoate polyprenyltransferase